VLVSNETVARLGGVVAKAPKSTSLPT